MRREESDLAIVPRKPGNAGGGKGEAVKEETMQLSLIPRTAESRKRGDAEAARDQSCAVPSELPKRGVKRGEALSAMVMEEVAEVENLREAFREVARNRGAHGIDGLSIEDVRANLERTLREVSRQLLEGTYQPGMVRRVWIPKGGGGKRGLGIPTVVDRTVQQAVLRVLQPHIDPTFDESSHGFRPRRSCHTAVQAASQHVEAGYGWVVDIDLEKFFDTVNHQRLMAQLERRIDDRRITRLIRRMLRAKVALPEGVVIETMEGTPQGGPLSPLLSNIVLSELDEELRRRGHRVVRYADDCNIYVRSERAGRRVFESITRFIERRMRLKVNREKSAVAEPQERHFLGFRLVVNPQDLTVEIGLSKRTRDRMAQRVRELTPRNLGIKLQDGIKRINAYLKGWSEFFKVCDTDNWFLSQTDAHIRRRLRAILLKQWKHKLTRLRKLTACGVSKRAAGRAVYGGSRALWALSIHYTVHRALRNQYFENLGLVSLEDEWERRHPIVPRQTTFAWA